MAVIKLPTGGINTTIALSDCSQNSLPFVIVHASTIDTTVPKQPINRRKVNEIAALNARSVHDTPSLLAKLTEAYVPAAPA